MAESRNQFSEFRRHCETNGVRNIQGGGACFDDCLKHLAQKLGIGASGIFGRKFHVIAERLGEGYGLAGLRQALIACDAQLILQMNVGSRQEDVNARASRILQSFPGAFDIGPARPSQSGNDRPADQAGDGLDRCKIAVRGDGKTRLNHVDAEAVELVRQAQLLRMIHAATRRLLSIAKGRVKNGNARLLSSHGLPRVECVSPWYGAIQLKQYL